MTTWNIDSVHSEIGFKIKHMMVSTVKGKFADFSGSVVAEGDNYETAKVTFTTKAASISTHNEQRDGHLRSADFFDVEKFPELAFESTKISQGSGNVYEVIGNFTMHGVTKEIALTAHFNGISKGGDGLQIAGVDIEGSLSRKDFGLTWNAAVETGGFVLSDEVVLDISLELKEVK
ncbi:MAG: YceI family protein [Candidatus Taylorbacteria bacterium]|nr:YceI family protein [Candidatus Taylorbacteria bacterium]